MIPGNENMAIGPVYVRPPINEIALSVSLATATLFDAYDVRSFHDLFRHEFPGHERTDPIEGVDFEQYAGLTPLNADGRATRWWFTSADGADILQVQQNFIARNWRRMVGIDDAPKYPGFTEVRGSFDKAVNQSRTWHRGQGRDMPKPRAVELMYDDVLPGLIENEKFMLSSMLNHLSSLGSRMANWQNAWIESVTVPGAPDATLSVQIVAAAASVAGSSEPRPVVRIIWRAAMETDSWSTVAAFFDAAHAHIGRRFHEIVADKVKSNWSVL